MALDDLAQGYLGMWRGGTRDQTTIPVIRGGLIYRLLYHYDVQLVAL